MAQNDVSKTDPILLIVTDENDKLVIDDIPPSTGNIIIKEGIGTEKIADVKVEIGKIGTHRLEHAKKVNLE